MSMKCSICGKKFGFLEGKIALADGMMCSSCWEIAGLGNSSQATYEAMHRTVHEMRVLREKVGTNPNEKVNLKSDRTKINPNQQKLLWEEFYKGFLSWTPRQRNKALQNLAYFGKPEEVFEVCIYSSSNPAFLNKFIKNALAEGVRFTPHQVVSMIPSVNRDVLTKMADTTTGKFTNVQLEKLYSKIGYADFYRIASKHGVHFAQETPQKQTHTKTFVDEEDFVEEDDFEPRAVPPKPHGHDGHCDGDCANCPPHYGYRYGRWYYGHDHIEGCEFGGNRGGATWEIQKRRLEEQDRREQMNRRR